MCQGNLGPLKDRDDYGWGVRVRRPFGARGRSSVRYESVEDTKLSTNKQHILSGTRLGDLQNKQPTHTHLHTPLENRGAADAKFAEPNAGVCVRERERERERPMRAALAEMAGGDVWANLISPYVCPLFIRWLDKIPDFLRCRDRISSSSRPKGLSTKQYGLSFSLHHNKCLCRELGLVLQCGCVPSASQHVLRRSAGCGRSGDPVTGVCC